MYKILRDKINLERNLIVTFENDRLTDYAVK